MMSKRKNYYEYERSSDFTAFDSPSKYDHEGSTIKINSVDALESLAMDYLSTKRGGTYYDSFEYTLKLISVMKQQARVIEELHNNTII
jgi:hypothetical protein